jgi:hypothetical protein
MKSDNPTDAKARERRDCIWQQRALSPTRGAGRMRPGPKTTPVCSKAKHSNESAALQAEVGLLLCGFVPNEPRQRDISFVLQFFIQREFAEAGVREV